MDRKYALVQGGTHIEYGFAHVTPVRKRGVANCWKLQLLVVKRGYRGRHYGTALLRKVLWAADAEGATITLTVDPFPTCPLLPSQLRAFYRRYGFHSTRKCVNYMIRRP